MAREGLCEGMLPRRGSDGGDGSGGSGACATEWLLTGAKATDSAITTVVEVPIEFPTAAMFVLFRDGASPVAWKVALGTELHWKVDPLPGGPMCLESTGVEPWSFSLVGEVTEPGRRWWTLRCLRKFPDSQNLRPQNSHSNGRSPVCRRS